MSSLEFVENRGVIMTSDKKCILRGSDKYSRTLYLVDEKPKQKVKMWRQYRNIYVDTCHLLVSDDVKEYYGLENNYYNKEKMGELISVKMSVRYKIE